MRKIFVIVFLSWSVMTASAQFTYDYLRAADNYYKKADYYSAAQYYEKYLGTAGRKQRTVDYNPYTVPSSAVKKNKVPVSSRQQALYRVAESYRLLHDHAKAAGYYQQIVEANSSAEFPLARYYYAIELRALANYDMAEKEFNGFLDEHTTKDQYSEAAKKELMSLRFIQTQLVKKDLKLYNVQKAAEPLNTEGANYAPVWLNENTLLFTSTRIDSTVKNQSHSNRVYAASVANGMPGDIRLLSLPQAAAMHQGVVSLTPDGNTMFLTRWTVTGGKKVSAIYSSKKTERGWSAPVLLDSLINATGYSTQQPFVMPNGKYLLYASDKTGGYGGFDLWYAELDANAQPLRTGNLGQVINSVNDEQAPYYHAPSGTLVFSANGRIGMGGFDFFYSKGNIEKWNTPVNFGYPVNSVKDDIYLVSRGGAKNMLEDAWLSSDRAAKCCLELFYLKKIQPKKQVRGNVVSCDDQSPLAGVTVNILDTVQNKVVYTQTTAADGSYSFTLDEYQPLKAVAAVSGYSRGSLPFNAPEDVESDELINPVICLIKDMPAVEEPVVLENVYYDFDKSTLRPESYAALDKLVEMLNAHPDMIIELSAHTDNLGNDTYNLRLSEARAKSCVAYLISKGIGKDRLQAKGYGSSQPVAPNKQEDGTDNPEGRRQNRRTEFKIIGNGQW